jgi:hypothetical protein
MDSYIYWLTGFLSVLLKVRCLLVRTSIWVAIRKFDLGEDLLFASVLFDSTVIWKSHAFLFYAHGRCYLSISDMSLDVSSR